MKTISLFTIILTLLSNVGYSQGKSASTSDLAITSVKMIPSNPKNGEKVSFVATVQNKSKIATPTGAKIVVLFNIDGDGPEFKGSETAIKDLAAGKAAIFRSSPTVWKAQKKSNTATHNVAANIYYLNQTVQNSVVSNVLSANVLGCTCGTPIVSGIPSGTPVTTTPVTTTPVTTTPVTTTPVTTTPITTTPVTTTPVTTTPVTTTPVTTTPVTTTPVTTTPVTTTPVTTTPLDGKLLSLDEPQWLIGVLDGTNAPAQKNTIRWDIFPDFVLPTELTSDYADLPIFTNDFDVASRSGFKATMKKGWTTSCHYNAVYNDPTSTFSSGIIPNTKEIQGKLDNGFGDWINYGKIQTCNVNLLDANGSIFKLKRMKKMQIDIEEIQNPEASTEIAYGMMYTGSQNTSAAGVDFNKKYISATLPLNPNFTVHVYGQNYTGVSNIITHAYYDGQKNDNNSWWMPNYDKSWYSSDIAFKSSLSNIIKQAPSYGKILLETNFYHNTIYPMTSSLYKRDANGSYIYDSNGERLFRIDSFTETIRGEECRWTSAGTRNANGDRTEAIGSYRFETYRPQTYWAVWNFYGMFQKRMQNIIALQQTLLNSTKIDKSLYNTNNIGFISTFQFIHSPIAEYQDGTEYVKHPMRYGRQLSPYQLFFDKWLNFILIKNDESWAGYGSKGQGLTTKQGEPYPRGDIFIPDPIDPTQIWYHNLYEDLSQVENLTGINYQTTLAQKLGFFSGKDDLLVFTDFTKFNEGECILAGRFQNNKLLLFLAEPHLDLGETMSFTIGNTKNSFTQQVILGDYKTSAGVALKMPKVVAIQLPTKDTYTASDVWIQYKTRKGTIKKKNGRFEDIQ